MILMVIYLGYIMDGLIHGSASANSMLLNSFIYYLFVVVYITATFSSFTIIKGYKAPLHLPNKLFKPKVEAFPDYIDTSLVLHSIRKKGLRNNPINGMLIERKVVNQDYNWYLFKDEENFKYYLLKPLSFKRGFSINDGIKIKLCQLDSETNLKEPIFDKKNIISCRLLLGFLKQ